MLTFITVLAEANPKQCLNVFNTRNAASPKKSIPQLIESFFSIEKIFDDKLTQARSDLGDSEINDDYRSLTSSIYAQNKKDITALKKMILNAPAQERIGYLRGLSKVELLQLEELLDALFGLDINQMDQAIADEVSVEGTWGYDTTKKKAKYGDEEIWYAPGGGQQSQWRDMFQAIEAMNLQPNQLVSDFGSGIGRLGLLIGLLRPDVNFIGLELVEPRVAFANRAAEKNGFTNVKYLVSNLADQSTPLPPADHIYMYNPTNGPTSDILTQRLKQLSEHKDFRVYLKSGLASQLFYRVFRSINDYGAYIRIYEPHRNEPPR